MLYQLLNIYLAVTILRPQDFLGPLKGTPLVFIIMSVLGCMWFLSNIDKKIKTNIDKIILSFFAVIILSGVFTLYPSYAVNNAVDVIKIALIYICIVTIIDTEEKFAKSLWLFTVLISLVALMAVLQPHGYDVTGAGMYWASDKEVWQIRGVGIFDNPNDLAYSILPSAAVSLACLLFDKRIPVKLFSSGILLILSYCLYLTYSRGGFLAYITLCVIILNYAISNVTFKKIVLLVSACCLVVVFATKTKDYRSDESAMGRVEAWSAGMSMFTHNPLFGVGKGNFNENHKRDSHNSFVRAGSELGFVGLYAFIGILFWGLRSLRLIINGTGLEQYKMYAVALLAYLCAFMVGSVFSTRTYDILLVIAAAFISVLVRLVLSKNKTSLNETFGIEKLWNKKIFIFTVSTVVIWKIFLIQTW
jgi:O-antigen ligase